MSAPVAAPRRTAWPFAIVCTPTGGFAVAAAPDVLVARRQTALLGDSASGEPGDHAYLREVTGSDGATLWLLYRVVPLKAAEVGQPGEWARSGSRAAPLTEGVVLLERPARAPGAEYFDAVHERVGGAVREYFLADDPKRPARPFPGTTNDPAEGEPLRLVVLDRMTREEPLHVADVRFPAGTAGPGGPTGPAAPTGPPGDRRPADGGHRPGPDEHRPGPDGHRPAAGPGGRVPAGFGGPALGVIAVLSLLVVLLSVLLALK
ncbi:hypothetical protein [Kitasatospora sp. NPDC057541]|uniref:hypothetical protein n=1 Tax=unclassified Kitasatospora TaxID=2633591 RepID=UPI0036ADDD96